MNDKQFDKLKSEIEFHMSCLKTLQAVYKGLTGRDYVKPIRLNEYAPEFWVCKYHGENEYPICHKCVREDGKMVSDELF